MRSSIRSIRLILLFIGFQVVGTSAVAAELGQLEKLKAQYPDAVALAEAYLQNQLDKHSAKYCRQFGFNTGSDVLRAIFKDDPGISGNQDEIEQFYVCLMTTKAAMPAAVNLMVDLDAAEADGATDDRDQPVHRGVFLTKDTSSFCRDEIGNVRKKVVNGDMSGSMVSAGFRPCMIASIKTLVPMAAYWNGSADYNHPDTQLEFGDWKANNVKTRAYVSSSTDLLSRLSIECVREPLSLRVNYWSESWNVAPESMHQNGEMASMKIRVDRGDWLEVLGQQWPVLPFKGWVMEDGDSDLTSLVQSLQSGSQISLRASDGYRNYSYDFSLRGSKAAIDAVVANCNRKSHL